MTRKCTIKNHSESMTWPQAVDSTWFLYAATRETTQDGLAALPWPNKSTLTTTAGIRFSF
jgi:hypothetical protein